MYSYLIKYASELSTKKSPTRKRMINRVYSNLHDALQYHNIKIIKGRPNWDFIFIETEEEAMDVMKNIPGIQHLAKVDVIYTLDKDEIIEKGFQFFKDSLKGKKFAVICHRKLKEKTPYSSMDIGRELGSALYYSSDGVDLTNPDIECHVEIRGEGVYYYSEKQQGLMGFPIGNTGKSITMLSGGIDSPVASYIAIKIGITPIFVYFDLGSKEQKDITFNTFKFIYEKYLPGQQIKFINVPFLETIEYIRTLPYKYQNLLLKYFFYKVAEKLGYKYKVKAIITGEALGQVSTQTIENIVLLDKYISFSVFRPTLFMPKLEIMSIAEKIGTLSMAYKGEEYCAIATRNVATSGRKDIFDKIINKIPLDDILDRIFEKIEVKSIDNLFSEENNEEVKDDKTFTIINMGDKKIEDFEGEVITIDLDDAIDNFKLWDKSKNYRLHCEQGIKSEILASFMKEEGYNII